MIASQCFDLMRYLISSEGLNEMYQEVFVDQVRQVIEAYQARQDDTAKNRLEGSFKEL